MENKQQAVSIAQLRLALTPQNIQGQKTKLKNLLQTVLDDINNDLPPKEKIIPSTPQTYQDCRPNKRISPDVAHQLRSANINNDPHSFEEIMRKNNMQENITCRMILKGLKLDQEKNQYNND